MAKTPQQECAMYFFDLLGSLPAHKVFVVDWMDNCESLLNELNCEPEELQGLMHFAVVENTDKNPAFDSTVQIAQSRNPMETFAKRATPLMGKWKALKKSAAAVSKKEEAPPLPSNIVQWMMVGFGVNEPLGGFKTWQDKLDSVKRSWYAPYGVDWKTAPFPASVTDEMCEMWFNDSNKNRKTIGDDED